MSGTAQKAKFNRGLHKMETIERSVTEKGQKRRSLLMFARLNSGKSPVQEVGGRAAEQDTSPEPLHPFPRSLEGQEGEGLVKLARV